MPAFTYDAENHLLSTAGQTYLYDGDGKRVEKASGSPLTANKLYWYGTEDSPVLETDAAGNELYRYFRFQGLLSQAQRAHRNISGLVGRITVLTKQGPVKF